MKKLPKNNPLTRIDAAYRNWLAYAENPALAKARGLHAAVILREMEAAKEMLREMEIALAEAERQEPMLRLVTAEYANEIKAAYRDDAVLQADMLGELEVAA